MCIYKRNRIYSVSLPVFFMTPSYNLYFLYSTLLCKKIARAPGGHKRFMLTKLGGGGRNRIDPRNQWLNKKINSEYYQNNRN